MNNKLYNENISVCLLPNTDIFASEKHEAEFFKILEVLIKKRIKNPICFITKCCPINKEYLSELVNKIKHNNQRIVAYISYSGLGPDVEVGINHNKTREAFKVLKEIGLDIIHYFRPFTPTNFKDEKIQEIISFVRQYAKTSVISGLKMYPEMIEQLTFWEELQEELKNNKKFCNRAINAEYILPKGFTEYFKNTQFDNYPLFYSNSCALSYVLGIPNNGGFFGTKKCKDELCPFAQIGICTKYYDNCIPNKENIKNILQKFFNKEVVFELLENHIVKINETLKVSEIVYLQNILHCKIFTKNITNDYWGNSINNNEIIEF